MGKDSRFVGTSLDIEKKDKKEKKEKKKENTKKGIRVYRASR
jgi:hypothetical protein